MRCNMPRVASEIEYLQTEGDIEEIVDHMMAGFKRVNTASKMNLGDSRTPFGTHAEIRAEVRSVADEVKRIGRLPVVTFSAGGISTPSDAALMMRQGMDGVFVGSGIFKSSDPVSTAEAIVMATHSYNDPSSVAEASTMIGEPMPGLEIEDLPVRMDQRGW